MYTVDAKASTQSEAGAFALKSMDKSVSVLYRCLRLARLFAQAYKDTKYGDE